MRIEGRIVRVRSTKQSVGIKVGDLCPRHPYRNKVTGTGCEVPAQEWTYRQERRGRVLWILMWEMY